MTSTCGWGRAALVVVLAWGSAQGGMIYMTDTGTGSSNGVLYQYDTVNNTLTAVETGLNDPRDLAYDPYDEQLYILGRETVYRYDFQTNTLSHQTIADNPSNPSPLGNPTRFTYDYNANPNLIYVQDANDNRVYTYQYDTNALQPLTSTPADPPGNLSRYTYDALDRRVYMTAPVASPGTTTVYQYDPVYNALSSQPVGGINEVSDIASDGQGNVYLSSMGTVYQYTYSTMGPLTPIVTLPNSEPITRFTYDARDNVLRIVSPTGPGVTTLYRYDFGTQNLSGQALHAPPGADLSQISSINARNPAVPEPSTLVIVAIAGVVLKGIRRRRGTVQQ